MPNYHNRKIDIFSKLSHKKTSSKSNSNGSKKVKNDGRWALNKLYPGLKSKKLKQDKEQIEILTQEFLDKINSMPIANMTGDMLGQAIEEFENITNKTGLISSYIELLHTDNVNNFNKTKQLEIWLNSINKSLKPFIEELANMPEESLLYKISSPKLAKYAPWLASIRSDKDKNNISPRVQKISQKFQNNLELGLSAFYQQKISNIEQILEETISGEDISDYYNRRNKLFKEQAPQFAMLLNTIISTRDIDRKWAGYKRQDGEFIARNKLNNKQVDMIFETVKKSYISLSHRYYKWLAKQHGKDKITTDEILAPKEEEFVSKFETEISWEDAQKIVTSAFQEFSPEFAKIAEEFFTEKYIDAFPRPKKDTGGFSYPTGPEGHPYILMNFYEDLDSLIILAHELGHGIHMVLSEKHQGGLLSPAHETLAETASIFAEILLFEHLLEQAQDTKEKQYLLEQQISCMLDSALMQMAYFDFEKRIYCINKTKTPNAEEISDIWLDILQDYYGPSVEILEDQRYSWCELSHFFEMPSFYVYSYSFAQIMVNSLYKLYDNTDNKEDFVANYTEILKAGMSRDVSELLQPFDLDINTEEFWKQGLSLIEDLLDELEQNSNIKLDKKLDNDNNMINFPRIFEKTTKNIVKKKNNKQNITQKRKNPKI